MATRVNTTLNFVGSAPLHLIIGMTSNHVHADLGAPLSCAPVSTSGELEQWAYPGYVLRFFNQRLVAIENDVISRERSHVMTAQTARNRPGGFSWRALRPPPQTLQYPPLLLRLEGPGQPMTLGLDANRQPPVVGGGARPVRRLRVLMVEDVELDAELIAHEITNSGHQATFVRVDTAAGLTTELEQQEWDLILTDYTMPLLTVPVVLRLVRDRHPHVPCILVSGTATEETARAAFPLGVDDFVSKFDLGALGPVVTRALDDADARREWLGAPRMRLQGGHELKVTERWEDRRVLEGRASLKPGGNREGLLLDEGAATRVQMQVIGCEVTSLAAPQVLYRSMVRVVDGW